LNSHKAKKSDYGAHKIGDCYYRLSFDVHPAKYLCLRAFTRIVGVSITKLYQACHFGGTANDGVLPEKLPTSKTNYSPKCDCVKAFLDYFSKFKTITVDDDNCKDSPKRLLAVGCYEPSDVYEEFQLINDVSPVSYTYFKKIWDFYKPHLTTFHDRACAECDFLTFKIKNAQLANDLTAVNTLRTQLEIHVKLDKIPHEMAGKIVAKSKLKNFEKGSLVLFADHWGKEEIHSCFKSLIGRI
jgi:hypothetical protein